LFICRVGGRGGANRSANLDVGGGSGACTGATKYFGVPRPGLRGTKPFGVARAAPAAGVGTGVATLLCATGGGSAVRGGLAAGGFAALFAAGSALPAAGRGAGLGHLAWTAFPGAGRAAVFFGAGTRAAVPLADAAFLPGAALRTGALTGEAYFAGA
jgi:hypothetical protein